MQDLKTKGDEEGEPVHEVQERAPFSEAGGGASVLLVVSDHCHLPHPVPGFASI